MHPILAFGFVVALAAQNGSGSPAATKCIEATPNYVESVAVSAWDPKHRESGVRVWIDPAMATVLDGEGRSLRFRIASRLPRWDVAHVPRVRAVVSKREDADISLAYGLSSARPRIDGTTTRTLEGSFTTAALIELNTLQALGHQTDVAAEASLLDATATAALHEFGHALGIHGHSPSRSDLMFADGSGEACGAACGPSAADKNTLAYLACRAIENGTGWAPR